jgi:hypothetical protein
VSFLTLTLTLNLTLTLTLTLTLSSKRAPLLPARGAQAPALPLSAARSYSPAVLKRAAVTPALGAPVSAAPVSAQAVHGAGAPEPRTAHYAQLRQGAPVGESSPSATVPAAPVSAAPVSAAPVPAVPVSAAPVSAAPVPAAPVSVPHSLDFKSMDFKALCEQAMGGDESPAAALCAHAIATAVGRCVPPPFIL